MHRRPHVKFGVTAAALSAVFLISQPRAFAFDADRKESAQASQASSPSQVSPKPAGSYTPPNAVVVEGPDTDATAPETSLYLPGLTPLADPNHLSLGAEVKEEVGRAGDVLGLRVISVEPDSTAARMGMKPGDIITELGELPVSGLHEVQSRLRGMGRHNGGVITSIRFCHQGHATVCEHHEFPI